MSTLPPHSLLAKLDINHVISVTMVAGSMSHMHCYAEHIIIIQHMFNTYMGTRVQACLYLINSSKLKMKGFLATVKCVGLLLCESMAINF